MKKVYVIRRPDNWCFVDEIFATKTEANKYLKKIKDEYPSSYNYFKKLRVVRVRLNEKNKVHQKQSNDY